MRSAVLVTVLALLAAACAETADTTRDPTRFVLATTTADGTRVGTAADAAPLVVLDPWRVARLARAIFPDVVVEDVEGGVGITVDSASSAKSLVEAARWADGLIRARRELEARGETPPMTDAGVIAETIRTWLRPEPSGATPDWGALSDALERGPVWEVAPVHAGMGSIVYAGMILRGPASSLAEDRARRLLSRATALRNVPDWLSWIAYRAWMREGTPEK